MFHVINFSYLINYLIYKNVMLKSMIFKSCCIDNEKLITRILRGNFFFLFFSLSQFNTDRGLISMWL